MSLGPYYDDVNRQLIEQWQTKKRPKILKKTQQIRIGSLLALVLALWA